MSPSILNTPSVAIKRGGSGAGLPPGARRARVGVRVAAQLGSREPRAIDERGVAEAIEEHALAASGEGADGGEIRQVSAREQQRALPPREVGELLLQASCSAPWPLTRCEAARRRRVRPAHSLMAAAQRRMVREPEVVVAAEIDAAGAR